MIRTWRGGRKHTLCLRRAVDALGAISYATTTTGGGCRTTTRRQYAVGTGSGRRIGGGSGGSNSGEVAARSIPSSAGTDPRRLFPSPRDSGRSPDRAAAGYRCHRHRHRHRDGVAISSPPTNCYSSGPDGLPRRIEHEENGRGNDSSNNNNNNNNTWRCRRRRYVSTTTTTAPATTPSSDAAEDTAAAKTRKRSVGDGIASSTREGNRTGEPPSPPPPLPPPGPAKNSTRVAAEATESDFARFLAGEMKAPADVKGGGSSEGGGGVASFKSKRQGNRMIALDVDNELLRQIRVMQAKQQEKFRKQTARNVYRALMGNVIICGSKFVAWLSSGSSGLLAEFIHSVVDCGNQALLLVGLRSSTMVADRRHPYGYGKSVYFWALVSALGTFFLGAGVSMTHAIGNLIDPSLHEINVQVWGVLALSFAVDGYVLKKTVYDILQAKPNGVGFWRHVSTIRDPATLAILLEDGAACLGVLLAIGGLAASHATGNPLFDAAAGVSISALLGAMGLALVRVNHRFLLGQAVDREIIDDIEKILLSRRSIDGIGSVQSQWTGPETFSYKAEVDFDGTYLAAKLMPIYEREFLQIRDTMDDELQVLLALYAEDVMRTVEREVRHVEAHIRKRYPGAEYIELEPMSIHADRLAIDDNLEAELRRVESDNLNRYLRSLRTEQNKKLEETGQNQSGENSPPPAADSAGRAKIPPPGDKKRR